ncbi:protein-tyrosine phosphatase [Cytobacillus horneckiae]|uniref:Protein-tyrosine-phosphatase n=1 Tax=Cytobacillus horneckiae TaxID=549687 RepID=A0A2N0ZEQ9_9BACI|nr:tyrosine-protein phosphatase [Cytobacillus horneckiae]MBN6889430.1 tyrosine-protein phosphatase [Cytobacillus horneckiae]MCM3176883.1 tyrosine-protein phosphatase [Cytobacillus horneckiae]MEC1156727.1 tyrosine-protein phosphatase [Cytobacillus horneckiae]MED2939052.1 tyrosine-protein phosphatase [Cytobacillus horneckiae]PKG28000.1 protein-tyrosine-phosphatase [Cytobacillus horneckiae]
MFEMIEKFDGIYNFRDIGGLVTENGQRMKSGVLFRSDELSRLSARDIEIFGELNIHLICDLRTASEQKSKPSKMQAENGVQLVNVSINDKSWEITHLDLFKFLFRQSNDIDFEAIMLDMYRYMAFGCQKEIKTIFNLITEQDNLPALVHCTGGKDRTGFISSLIQSAVGVPYETVSAQYLHSNELIGPRMTKIETALRWMSLFRLKPEQIKPVLEVRQAYLNKAYDAIFEKYRSMDDYLREECRIEDETLQKLRDIMLED